MSSTGTSAYTINRDGLIKSSLRALRVLQDGQTPSAQQITDGAEVLNTLIKDIQSDGLALWTYQTIQIPMQVNKNSYTIGPTGADVTANRPLRLFDGTFIRQTLSGTDFDTPLRVISRAEYKNFGSKGSKGTPNSVYYDSKIDIAGGLTSPSLGYGTLFVYTSPIDATRTVHGNFQRQLFDMTNATDEFDFPSENFQMLRWGLAAELSDEYEVPEDRIHRIHQKAKYYRDKLEAWSVETTPMQFTPEWSVNTARY